MTLANRRHVRRAMLAMSDLLFLLVIALLLLNVYIACQNMVRIAETQKTKGFWVDVELLLPREDLSEGEFEQIKALHEQKNLGLPGLTFEVQADGLPSAKVHGQEVPVPGAESASAGAMAVDFQQDRSIKISVPLLVERAQPGPWRVRVHLEELGFYFRRPVSGIKLPENLKRVRVTCTPRSVMKTDVPLREVGAGRPKATPWITFQLAP